MHELEEEALREYALAMERQRVPGKRCPGKRVLGKLERGYFTDEMRAVLLLEELWHRRYMAGLRRYDGAVHEERTPEKLWSSLELWSHREEVEPRRLTTGGWEADPEQTLDFYVFSLHERVRRHLGDRWLRREEKEPAARDERLRREAAERKALAALEQLERLRLEAEPPLSHKRIHAALVELGKHLGLMDVFDSLRQEHDRAQRRRKARTVPKKLRRSVPAPQRIAHEPIGHQKYHEERALALEGELGWRFFADEKPPFAYRQSRIREWRRELKERDDTARKARAAVAADSAEE